LNVALSGEHQLEPGALLQLPLRVLGESEAGFPHLAQPLRSEPREIDEAAEGEKRLVRRDVRRRLLAPDVLLARLQGEDIAALPLGVEPSRRRMRPGIRRMNSWRAARNP